MEGEEGSPVLIQIEHPDSGLEMRDAMSLLEPAGVSVDASYGPICVNREAGRYVVRGRATDEARERAARLPGVSLFRDLTVAPTR